MTIAIAKRTRVLLVLAVIAAVGFLWQLRPHSAETVPPPAGSGRLLATPHYLITSTASDSQTKLVADAAESLHAGYMTFFPQSAGAAPIRLKLRLYKNQAEFKLHNKASFWAEAYYLPPNSHAYFAADEENPYHWMLHEVTHQLNYEVARLANTKWINEGLATYFGTSAIRDGKLIPGQIDVHTYPIWVVSKLSLTGDFDRDIQRGKIVGLRALVSGVGGPKFDEKVNTYYVGYWSLTHFLFHFENGRYAASYRKLIAAGGSIDDFERIVGPVDRIQSEWYAYLHEQVALTK